MGRQRKPLFEPQHRDHPLQLQERDFAILETVYHYRFIDSDQLTALFADTVADPAVQGQQTHEAIKRRLSKLFHHGYLVRPRAQISLRVRYGSRPLIYALGSKGAQELREVAGMAIPASGNWAEKNKAVGEPFLLHTLMVSKLRVAVTLACRWHFQIDLERWLGEGELQNIIYPTVAKTRSKRFVPDGFFTLRFLDRPEGSNRAHFFVEANRTTSHPSHFGKLLAYLDYHRKRQHAEQYDIQEFRMLTVCTTPQRRDNALAYCREGMKEHTFSQKDQARFLFATEKDYTIDDPTTVWEPVWFDLTGSSTRSLLPKGYEIPQMHDG